MNWCKICGDPPAVWVTDRRKTESSAFYCRTHAPAERPPWVVWEMLPDGPEPDHRGPAPKDHQTVRGRRGTRGLGRCTGCGGWVVWTWGRCPNCDDKWGAS